jgi:formyl-CoA transferase
MAAFAISAALRQREATGAGAYVDLAMLDSVFALLAVSHGTMGGRAAGAEVEAWARRPAYDIYEAGDGRFVALAAAREASCGALFDHLGRPDLAEFGLLPGDAGQEAAAFLRQILRTKPARNWVEELSALDIEITRVNTPEEAFDDPQLRERGMIAETTHPAAGALRQIGVPCADIATAAPAPSIGQDTEAILRDLGCDEARISELRTDDVV